MTAPTRGAAPKGDSVRPLSRLVVMLPASVLADWPLPVEVDDVDAEWADLPRAGETGWWQLPECPTYGHRHACRWVDRDGRLIVVTACGVARSTAHYSERSTRRAAACVPCLMALAQLGANRLAEWLGREDPRRLARKRREQQQHRRAHRVPAQRMSTS